MSKDEKIVRYQRRPLTTAQRAELERLAASHDEAIDLSDMPERTPEQLQNARRGFYRALKEQTTLRIDADVLDWFRRNARDGKGYQTDINQALRDHIARKTG